jgi:HEAT repeat protein
MRQSASIALGCLAGPTDTAVIAALELRLDREAEPYGRLFAAMALARIGGPDAIAALRRCHRDGRFVDRPATALALGVAGDTESAKSLRMAFAKERDPEYRSALAVALGLLRDQESAPLLRDVVASKKDVSFRGHCLTALGTMQDEETADLAHRILLEDGDPRMRLSCATTLGLLRDRRAVPALEDIARRADHVFVRGNALRLLGIVGNRWAGDVLLAYAKDRKQHVVVRTYAVAALGVLARRADVPVLARVGMDSNFAVFIDPLEEIALLL